MKKLLLACGMLSLLTVVLLVATPKQAHAAVSWCDVLAPANDNSGNNCLNGVTENALNGVNTKSEAIAAINKFAGYGGYQTIGADYIKCGLEGKSAGCSPGTDWEDRVNDSRVSVSVDSDYYTCTNTAYDPSSKSVVKYTECGDYTAVVFSVNGVIKYAIKVDCGNPIGDLPGLPSPTPQDNLPTGSIAISCNADGTADLKFTYNDADGQDDPGNPNQTAAYTRIEKVSDRYSFGDYYSGDTLSANNHWNRQNYGASPTTQKNVTGDGTLEAWLYVGDDGPNAPNQDHGNNYYASDYPTDRPTKITCKQPTQTNPGDCPGDPTIDANTLVTLQTPYKTPNGTASWAGRTTAAKNNVQYQDTATSNSNFVIADISVGGAREVPSITSYGTNKQTVTVNYQKFVSTYPYDSNQAEAKYKTNYKETTWKADTFDHWACDSGGTYNGDGTEATGGGTGKCGTHPVSEGLLCPTAAFSHSDGTCYFLAPQYPTQATCTAHSGYNWLHSECLHVVSGYRCPSGEYASGDNPTYCYKNVNYPAPTEYWAYTNQGTTSGLSQNNTSTGNYKMNACFARNFNVVSVSVTASKNSNENPSSGSAAATADVRFSAPQGIGVRVPYSITSGLNFTARMQGQVLTCSNSASGPFTVTSGSTATTAEVSAAPIPGISCTVVQPAPLGGQVCANYTVSPTGDKVSDTGVVVTSDGGSVSGSACSTPVVNEPYLKVFGGDVAAGTGFLNGNNVSCSNNSNASIQTFNTGVNPYGGSGTALAALSVKRIATNVTDEGFASAQGGGVSGSTVPAPKTLSFGNDDPVSRYGGDYGASSSGCSPDYSSGAPTQTASNGLAGAVNLSGLNGTYVATDTLQLSGTITQGHHVLIYSSWPVAISGPIAFSNPGVNVADMPSFSLIVKNNDITIAQTVSTLYGNYIAQGGTIDDCDAGNIYPACNAKLTVYGSFVANNIKFYRMGQNGSLRYSATDSGPGGNNASEEFDYSPATWLAQPPASGTPPAYDAVTSLPPVL